MENENDGINIEPDIISINLQGSLSTDYDEIQFSNKFSNRLRVKADYFNVGDRGGRR